MRWSLYLHLQTKWHKNTSTGISRQKIAAGLREASCQSWEWFEIYPTADRPASRPTTDRHRLDPDCGDEDWDNFGLCTGIWYLHWSLPWQVVAWPSMVEWKSGQVDGATRHKGDPTPVHNLHITSSSIWQLAKTQNNKVGGQKTFSAICSEANATKHTGHIFVFEFYLPFQENQRLEIGEDREMRLTTIFCSSSKQNRRLLPPRDLLLCHQHCYHHHPHLYENLDNGRFSFSLFISWR